MIYTSLKDRLNPPKLPELFVRDKTTPAFKNQILGLIHEMYGVDEGTYTDSSCIGYYSDEIMTEWSITNCLEPLNPGKSYPFNALFSKLKELDGYDFFELLDCMIYILYSNPYLCNDPDYIEFFEDLERSLLLHGIDYTIIEGHLVYRTERTINEAAIQPCLAILQRNGLQDADGYLLQAFRLYKEGKYNGSIESAVKSLENVIQSIIEHEGIQCDPRAKMHEKISLIVGNSPSSFLSVHFGEQYAQMDKIFQTAMSSRNEITHGSKKYTADEALAEHTINIVCSDILFLVRISFEQ